MVDKQNQFKKYDQIKMRDYMDRRVTPPERVTSPTEGPPSPRKKVLKVCINCTWSALNPRTYEGEEVVAPAPHPQSYSEFFLEDKTSAPEVFCSCSRSFKTSLVIVSYYGYDYDVFK